MRLDPIDLASQLVPEEQWKPHGLHTWLSARANAAFRQLKVGERKIRGSNLTYVFEVLDDKPMLARVTLG